MFTRMELKAGSYLNFNVWRMSRISDDYRIQYIDNIIFKVMYNLRFFLCLYRTFQWHMVLDPINCYYIAYILHNLHIIATRHRSSSRYLIGYLPLTSHQFWSSLCNHSSNYQLEQVFARVFVFSFSASSFFVSFSSSCAPRHLSMPAWFEWWQDQPFGWIDYPLRQPRPKIVSIHQKPERRGL